MISEYDIKWVCVSHLALQTHYLAKYADAKLGITKEVVTKRTQGGYGIGKSKAYYYIDKDPRTFLSAQALVDAYNDISKRVK